MDGRISLSWTRNDEANNTDGGRENPAGVTGEGSIRIRHREFLLHQALISALLIQRY